MAVNRAEKQTACPFRHKSSINGIENNERAVMSNGHRERTCIRSIGRMRDEIRENEQKQRRD